MVKQKRQMRKQEDLPEILRVKNRAKLAAAILAEYKSMMARNDLLDLDVRSWAYRLEGMGMGIGKGDFRLTGDRLTELRKFQMLPMDICSEDKTRKAVDVVEVSKDAITEMGEWLAYFADTYTPIHIESITGVHLELVVEKNVLVGLFQPVTRPRGIPISNNKGQSDLKLREAILQRADRFQKLYGVPTVVLLFGDHDIGGLQITDGFYRNLESMVGAAGLSYMPEITTRRIGLNIEDIEALDLMWIENLETSGKYDDGTTKDLSNPLHPQYNHSHVVAYREKFGNRKVEANAIIRDDEGGLDILRRALDEYVTQEHLDEYQDALALAREPIRDLNAEVLEFAAKRWEEINHD